MPHDRRENAALAVELFVPNVKEAVAFYTGVLGFELLRADESAAGGYTFAALAMGEAFLMLMSDLFYGAPIASRGAGVDVRVVVSDVDAIYGRLREAGVEIVHDIADREYRLRDFIVRDPWGFRLRFASPLR